MAGRRYDWQAVSLSSSARATLETGCRYGELARLEIADFNPDAGTVTIRKAKSSKPRHVILTPEGADFFRQHCAGLNNNTPKILFDFFCPRPLNNNFHRAHYS